MAISRGAEHLPHEERWLIRDEKSFENSLGPDKRPGSWNDSTSLKW